MSGGPQLGVLLWRLLHRSQAGPILPTSMGLQTHNDVSTTMIYTHVLNRGPGAVTSPADRVLAP